VAPQYEFVVTIVLKKIIIILLTNCKTQDTFVVHNLQNNRHINANQNNENKAPPIYINYHNFVTIDGVFHLLKFSSTHTISHHICVDFMDKHYKLNENMTSECFKQFVCTIIVFAWPMYLKTLIQTNVEQ